MTQPDLLDVASRPSNVADTSLEAYQRVKATLPEREYATFVELWRYVTRSGYGDATGGELAEWMGWPVTSVRPRLTSLLEKRLIEKTPARKSRCASEVTSCHGHRPIVPLAAVQRAEKKRRAAA